MRIASLILLLTVGLWSAPVSAAGYTATYDVYAGRIHALQARMTYTETGGRYTIDLSSETYGLLWHIIPWHAEFKTGGWVLKDRYQPDSHVSDTTANDQHEVNTYKYDKSGKFLGFTQIVDGKDVTKKDLDPSIMAGTTDMLSANFNVMRALANGKGCPREEMIFDSERSYRLMFRQKSNDTLKPNKYSSFSGDTQACEAEVKPEGGKWHKKPRGWLKIQEQGREQGALPKVWYAAILKEKSAPDVPVKIVIKTNYGSFVARLASFEENPVK